MGIIPSEAYTPETKPALNYCYQVKVDYICMNFQISFSCRNFRMKCYSSGVRGQNIGVIN